MQKLWARMNRDWMSRQRRSRTKKNSGGQERRRDELKRDQGAVSRNHLYAVVLDEDVGTRGW